MKISMQSHAFSEVVTAAAVREASWLNRQEQPGQNLRDVSVHLDSRHRHQVMDGLGGAFSELGWQALLTLSLSAREAVVRALFDPVEGAGFTYCRLPVGASDFALAAHTPCDTAGDLAMATFSLAQDERYLVPFLRAARQVNPALKIFASPWSPPGWMKDSGDMCNGGALKDDPAYYRAYALYLRKFVEGYAALGLPIDRLCIQNEPDSGSKFPTCVMPPEQMVKFTVEYLAPEFAHSGVTTELWGGTFRTVSGLQSHDCMRDPRFRQAIRGLGFQYAYPDPIADIQRLYPGTRVMHTESVCYDGANTVTQAAALFQDFITCVQAGCGVYSYWNMVLNETGLSSWGWRQNSLVVVDRARTGVQYTPDYAVMRLLASQIRPGARRIEAFCFVRRVIAFMNPDGTVALFLHNEDREREIQVVLDGESHRALLPAQSLVCLTFPSSGRSGPGTSFR